MTDARTHLAREPPLAAPGLALHSYTPLLLLPWRPAFAVRGKPMEFDRQELSWKARHDRRAPGRGAGRLILALALLGAAAVAAQVESSPSRSARVKVNMTAAATPDAP